MNLMVAASCMSRVSVVKKLTFHVYLLAGVVCRCVQRDCGNFTFP